VEETIFGRGPTNRSAPRRNGRSCVPSSRPKSRKHIYLSNRVAAHTEHTQSHVVRGFGGAAAWTDAASVWQADRAAEQGDDGLGAVFVATSTPKVGADDSRSGVSALSTAYRVLVSLSLVWSMTAIASTSIR
jgi:hypothetical protein